MNASTPAEPAERIQLSDLPKTVVLPGLGWRVVVLAVAGGRGELSCVCAINPTADAWDLSGPYPRPTDDVAVEASAFDAAGDEIDPGNPSSTSSVMYPVVVASYFFESPPLSDDDPITLQLWGRRRGPVTSGPPSDPGEMLDQLSQVVDHIDGGLDLVERRAEAIEIVYAAKDSKTAVVRLVKDMSVPESVAHSFVHARISSFTERSRRSQQTTRRMTVREIERQRARIRGS